MTLLSERNKDATGVAGLPKLTTESLSSPSDVTYLDEEPAIRDNSEDSESEPY